MEWKFRGWDVIGQKWVYGDLVHNQKVTKTGLEPRVMVGGYEVAPESVGICLDVEDKTGQMIYEGDIVEIDAEVAEMFKIESRGPIRYMFANFYFGQTANRSTVEWICTCCGVFRGKVIGNMYQNQDLLEK